MRHIYTCIRRAEKQPKKEKHGTGRGREDGRRIRAISPRSREKTAPRSRAALHSDLSSPVSTVHELAIHATRSCTNTLPTMTGSPATIVETRKSPGFPEVSR